MPLCVEVGLGPGHIVLDGDRASQKRDTAPQFLAHVCCGQTAGLIKMLLGAEVGLSPYDIALDGDAAPPPPKRGTTALPQFSADVCRGHMAGWITPWYGGRHQPWQHYVRWGPTHPHGKGHWSPALHFSDHFTLAWSHISAIQCTSCNKWVHKKCSGIKGSMYKVMRSFICRDCSNPVISTGHTSVDIGHISVC